MNVQLGYALLRDRRVPLRPKLIALAIGAAVVGFTELLQIPLESLFAVILPIVGIVGDVVLDGVEAVFGPVLIATLLLPYLAPDPVRSTNPRRTRKACLTISRAKLNSFPTVRFVFIVFPQGAKMALGMLN
jgi:hypothetical protein